MYRDSFIAPLDGKHELFGDAIGSLNRSEWFLIEFKRGTKDFSSERKKFVGMIDGAENPFLSELLLEVEEFRRSELPGTHEPHYFVYATGILEKSLALSARPYWGTWASGIDDLSDVRLSQDTRLRGCRRDLFNAYLRSLLLAKTAGVEQVSGGMLGAVIGVSPRDNRIVCMSVSDYATEVLKFLPEPSPPLPKAPSPSNNYSRPSGPSP